MNFLLNLALTTGLETLSHTNVANRYPTQDPIPVTIALINTFLIFNTLLFIIASVKRAKKEEAVSPQPFL
jgi:hypothetical protein